MFNSEFYPTPPSVAKEILEPIRFDLMMGEVWRTTTSGNKYVEHIKGFKYKNLVILDPEAGKGDLLEMAKAISLGCEEAYINYLNGCNYAYYKSEKENEYPYSMKYGDRDKAKHEFYAIEIEHELCAILRDKNYTVIDNDFLEYRGTQQFDLILMNPPFSNADEHLFKAWEILHEGKIVCLMNEETYKNQYTQLRQVIGELINKYSFHPVKYLGNCFISEDTERKTNVSVIAVYLEKKAKSNLFDPFEGFDMPDKRAQTSFTINEQNLDNQVMRADFVQSILDTVDSVNAAYIDWIKATSRLIFYYEPLKKEYGKDIQEVAWNCYKIHEATDTRRYNQFVKNVNTLGWDKIFSDMKIQDVMTAQVRRNFDEFRREQSQLALSKPNIYALFDMLMLNKRNIMEQNLVEVFDTMTKYHKENREYFEGWKTNDSWKVNRKVILPYYIKKLDLSNEWGDRFSINRYEITDIDRAMCYLKGYKLEHIKTTAEALNNKFTEIGHVRKGDTIDGKCESTFFDIRFWKKGTLHIYFKEEWLWQEFNRRVCLSKGWLPPEHSTK